MNNKYRVEIVDINGKVVDKVVFNDYDSALLYYTYSSNIVIDGYYTYTALLDITIDSGVGAVIKIK